MYQYKQEEVAWERVRDLQREMENSRLMAAGVSWSFTAIGLLARRAWLLAGLATSRPPRLSPAAGRQEFKEVQAARDAA